MLKKIEKYLDNNALLDKTNKVIVTLSGGVDSMVLLSLLKDLHYEIIIAHVNHNKRTESLAEEKYIRSLALDMDIPCEIYHYHHAKENNFHDDAHNERYNFFKEVALKYHTKQICTAHHADDNLETIIANLMSGSNLYGYSGISNKLFLDDYLIIRPLLCVSKKEILDYAQEKKIIYFEDSSNASDDYTRNRIRHHIIPTLKAESPNILAKAFSFSTRLKEAFCYIRKQSELYLANNQEIIICSSFLDIDECVQKDIICLMLEKKQIIKNEKMILLILKMIKNATPQSEISLSKKFLFKRRYDKAFIDQHKMKNFLNLILEKGQKAFIYNKYVVYFSKNKPLSNAKSIRLCYNDIAFPLTIRNRKNEDAIKLPFGHKKIKDLFIDKKIPLELRDEAIVFCDSLENILWIVDYAKSELVTRHQNTGDIYLICEEYKNE